MEMENVAYYCLGFASTDYLSLLPYIPMDDKVQMLEHLVQGGGPAATSAVAAARLGVKSAFAGIVGDDEPGKWLLRDFQKENVDISGIRVRENASSPVAYCWIDAPSGKRSVAWTRGSLTELQAEEVDKDAIQKAKMLHLDGHNPKGALEAAKFAASHHIPVNLDAGTLRDGLVELLPYVDILIASENFARQFSGEEDLEKALHKLASVGAEVTGVTMGSNGSMVLERETGKILHVPAFQVKVVDTTGAGDVFHAAFGVRYLETKDLAECLRFASAVSAIKCGKLGGRSGIPSREETDQFLRS